MFVCCEYCVLSGLCDWLITRPEESYRLWRSVVCDKKPRTRGGYSPARGLQNTNPQWVVAPEKKIKFVYEVCFLLQFRIFTLVTTGASSVGRIVAAFATKSWNKKREHIKDDCYLIGSGILRFDAVATEVANSFETSARYYKTVLRHVPEYCNFDSAARNLDLKTRTFSVCLPVRMSQLNNRWYNEKWYWGGPLTLVWGSG
jgi:hypothetical protein